MIIMKMRDLRRMRLNVSSEQTRLCLGSLPN